MLILFAIQTLHERSIDTVMALILWTVVVVAAVWYVGVQPNREERPNDGTKPAKRPHSTKDIPGRERLPH